jgi:hypothetical protein
VTCKWVNRSPYLEYFRSGSGSRVVFMTGLKHLRSFGFSLESDSPLLLRALLFCYSVPHYTLFP